LKKSTLLLFANLLLFLSFLGQSATILIMEFAFDDAESRASFLGQTRPEWLELHETIGFILVFSAVFHLLLNWGWVSSQVRQLLSRHNART